MIVNNTTNETSNNNPETPIQIINPENKGFFSTMTGAVIGFLGTGAGIISIVFVVAVVGSVTFFGIRRKEQ